MSSFQATIELDAGPATQMIAAGANVLIPLTVTNTGTVDLVPLGLDAPDCDIVTGPMGDTNLDGRIQTTETWTYDCDLSAVGAQQLVSIRFDAEALDHTPASDSDLVSIEIIGAASRISAGLVALYEFAEGTGSTVHDVSGVTPAFDLDVATPGNTSWRNGGGLRFDLPTVLTQAGPATKILNALQASDAITLEAWVRPSNITQSGPARIVAFSQDPFPNGGNFMLGQTDSHFDARLRTTTTSGFGTPGLASASGSAGTDQLSHLVFVRDAAGNESFYVDSVEVDSGTRGGTSAIGGPPTSSPWRTSPPSIAPGWARCTCSPSTTRR